ncbi:methylated-DNA--[protein]-cysteine S-methyltransferase [Clostridium merdae]|uniref:methylated-DNA--[protein]-cysteine S-methyltransferase n=1 Tax=Clostridium merdae TaxID=1958780 RepID=UPI000A26817C|nr:methylated-DNA--[protein]-cysteine S-methyltransferase [Clostridium merdae]
MFYSTQYSSPLGVITLASDGTHLVGLWFDGQKYFGGTVTQPMEEKNDLPVFHTVTNWLNRYFAGESPSAASLPLAPNGTDFRKEVWQILLEIPYGEVITYGQISEKIAARRSLAHMSSQAVGGAVGHNPISIIIPCHRVVGSNGKLTGYAGGTDKKLWLLNHEHAELSHKAARS